MKISENTRIIELIEKHPEAVQVLKKHKLDCVGCLGAERETIRNAAYAYGLDLDKLIKEIKSSISG